MDKKLALELQTISAEKTVLIYGNDFNEASLALRRSGFIGVVLVAKTPEELNDCLEKNQVDVIVNTTNKNIEDILKNLNKIVPVIENILDTRQLRVQLLEICA